MTEMDFWKRANRIYKIKRVRNEVTHEEMEVEAFLQQQKIIVCCDKDRRRKIFKEGIQVESLSRKQTQEDTVWGN